MPEDVVRPADWQYQAPRSLCLRLVVIVMAGEGPPSTSLLITAGKDVDADPGLRSGKACVGMTISLPPEGHRKGRLV